MTGVERQEGLGPGPIINQYLRDAKLSQVKSLVLVYRHGSAAEAARETGDAYNSITYQVRAMDKWFRTYPKVALIDETPGGGFNLTDNGKWVAATLSRIEPLIRSAMEGLDGSAVSARVPCTSDCIDDLADFISAMPEGTRRHRFVIEAVETSRFDPLSGDKPVLSLGSMYMSGGRLTTPDYVETLILRDRPIVAVMNEDPNQPGAVRFDEFSLPLSTLLGANVKVLTSLGGVIWDFLREHAHEVNEGLKNGTHVLVHDLHFGLKCLAAQVVPHGVMLVHGPEDLLAQQSPKYPRLEHFACYRLEESNERGNRAVTALFYNKRSAEASPPSLQEAYLQLWEAACRFREGKGP